MICPRQKKVTIIGLTTHLSAVILSYCGSPAWPVKEAVRAKCSVSIAIPLGRHQTFTLLCCRCYSLDGSTGGRNSCFAF